MYKLTLTAALIGLATAATAQAPAAAPAAAGASFESWAAKAREKLMALDTNHDGRISKDEFAARAAMMHGARRGDTMSASATPDAGAPKRDGSRMFDRFDANQDGFLDTAEINAMLARRFARMDGNRDGVLTPDERHAMHGPNAAEQ